VTIRLTQGDIKRPRDWRTQKDWFKCAWGQMKLNIELNPEQRTKALLKGLIAKDPDSFKTGQVRTLQRNVSHRRRRQLDQEARFKLVMRLDLGI
jgi:hypothetical protein